jgi:3-deoxy-manno-octulosonate cytidylyltransferase (CMP-KDO synthetase)
MGSSEKVEAIAIIPARIRSKRFPKKVLAKIGNKSMLEIVYRKAYLSKFVKEVYVATADKEIIEEVKKFGGKYLKTSPHHQSGTSRISEVANSLKSNIIINVQADEPLLNPKLLDSLIILMKKNPKIFVVTPISKINSRKELLDPNVVKVVIDNEDFVLYFSRSVIPFKKNSYNISYYKHIGIYGFRKKFISNYSSLKPSYLEKAESLEQLRILSNGYKIKALKTNYKMLGVDTLKDLENVRKIISNIKRRQI